VHLEHAGFVHNHTSFTPDAYTRITCIVPDVMAAS